MEHYTAGVGFLREGDVVGLNEPVRIIRQLLGFEGPFDLDITAAPVNGCWDSCGQLQVVALSGIVDEDDQWTLRNIAVVDDCESLSRGH